MRSALLGKSRGGGGKKAFSISFLRRRARKEGKKFLARRPRLRFRCNKPKGGAKKKKREHVFLKGGGKEQSS